MLQAIWDNQPEIVATGIESVHEQNTSIIKYNDENSLASVLNLALYTASNYYTVVRELPTGKGFADLVFMPRKKHLDKPAMIIELKWDQEACGAISQIKAKNYPASLVEYKDNLLLVGISYSKNDKKYECLVEHDE